METEDIAPAVMYDMQGEADLVYNNTLDERYIYIWWEYIFEVK